MKQQRTKIAAGAAAALVSLALATPAPATTSAHVDGGSAAPGDSGPLLALSADVTDAAIMTTPASTAGATADPELPSAPGDIPADALLAYQRAADILAAVAPRCSLSWTVLAALGKVTSDHGRSVASMRSIADTDVPLGPMQLPQSTWSVAGVDGDGDGERSVLDLDDAALAAAVYLCAGSASVATPEEIEAALHRFPIPTADIPLVLAYEAMFRAGDFQVPDDSEWATASVLSLQPVTGPGLEVTSPEVTPLDGLRNSTRQAARLRAELDAAVGRQVRNQVREALATTRQHADFEEPAPEPAVVQEFTAAVTDSPVAVPTTTTTITAASTPGTPDTSGTSAGTVTVAATPTLYPAVIAPSQSASPVPASATTTVDVPTTPPGSATPDTSPSTTTVVASPSPGQTPATAAQPEPSPAAGSSTPPAAQPSESAAAADPSPPASTTEPPPAPAAQEPSTTPSAPPPPAPAPETTAPTEQPSSEVVTGGADAPATSSPPSPACDPAEGTTGTPAADPSAPADEVPADPATLLPDPAATEPQPGETGSPSGTATDCGPATP